MIKYDGSVLSCLLCIYYVSSTTKSADVRVSISMCFIVTSFAGYLSTMLSENEDVDWKAVLTYIIGGDKEFKNLYRLAKRKVEEINQTDMCRTIFLDWMKATARHDDKVSTEITSRTAICVTANHVVYNDGPSTVRDHHMVFVCPMFSTSFCQ